MTNEDNPIIRIYSLYDIKISSEKFGFKISKLKLTPTPIMDVNIAPQNIVENINNSLL